MCNKHNNNLKARINMRIRKDNYEEDKIFSLSETSLLNNMWRLLFLKAIVLFIEKLLVGSKQEFRSNSIKN